MEEKYIGLTILDLKELARKAEEISGEWNGDLPGRDEDRAHCANDIIEKCKELEILLDEMQESN